MPSSTFSRAENASDKFGQFCKVGRLNHDAAFVGRGQAGDYVEEGGFAAAASAADHNLFPGRYLQAGDIQDRQAGAVRLAIRFFDVFDQQHGSGGWGRGLGAASRGSLAIYVILAKSTVP